VFITGTRSLAIHYTSSPNTGRQIPMRDSYGYCTSYSQAKDIVILV